MPAFMVTSPEGKKFRVNAPEGASQEEALEYAKKQFSSASLEKPKASIGRTALEQGLQGATFGFADELTDRLGAGIASVATGEKYSDLLKEARANTKTRFEAQSEQNPGTSLAANIGGALVTGGIGAGTKVGSSLANSLRAGGVGARIGKGALAGAASGGLYGAGAADDGERIEGATEGALVGGALGAALPAAGAAVSSLRRPNAPKASSEAFRELARNAYKTAEEKGGVLKPEFTNQFVGEIEKLKPQTEIGKIVGGDSAFTKVVDKITAIKDKPITLQAAQELDEILGDEIDNLADKTTGRLTKQGKKLFDVQSKLRGMIESADEGMIIGDKAGFDALKEGRRQWAKGRRLEDIERIIARAEMTDNPAAAIKTGFRTLASNPNRIKGYSQEERKLIEEAAKSGVIADSLRTIFGSRLLPIITGASGAGIGAVASSQAASMAARGIATRAQLNKADKVASQIISSQTPKDIGKLPPKEALKLLKESRGNK